MSGRFAASLLQLLALSFLGNAENPCEAEIQTACPDRPGADIAKCLKDKSEHETLTEISSGCTDFIALNVACAEDIGKLCDDGFFSSDVGLCLTEWKPDEHALSKKCAGVVQWAIPKSTDGDGPIDELGLTEKERQEKAEWHAKRRESRGAAVEQLREDRKNDQELAELKREDPVAYEQLLKERAEAKRSVDELKRRKRLMAAAEERKRREEEGGEEPENPEDDAMERRRNERREARRAASKKGKTNWLLYVLEGLLVAYVFFNVRNFFTSRKGKGKGKGDTAKEC